MCHGSFVLFTFAWVAHIYRLDEEYEKWNARSTEASVALDERDEEIGAVYKDLERDLRLLGATVIEDKLQDGVPETIEDLKESQDQRLGRY